MKAPERFARPLHAKRPLPPLRGKVDAPKARPDEGFNALANLWSSSSSDVDPLYPQDVREWANGRLLEQPPSLDLSP